MLENQLTDTNEKARIFEIANKELTLLKETLEEGLSETERTLKENSELHIKVWMSLYYTTLQRHTLKVLEYNDIM